MRVWMSIGNCKFYSIHFRSVQDERGPEHRHAPEAGMLAFGVGVDVLGLGIGVVRPSAAT